MACSHSAEGAFWMTIARREKGEREQIDAEEAPYWSGITAFAPAAQGEWVLPLARFRWRLVSVQPPGGVLGIRGRRYTCIIQGANRSCGPAQQYSPLLVLTSVAANLLPVLLEAAWHPSASDGIAKGQQRGALGSLL